jgi:hypothetical protein
MYKNMQKGMAVKKLSVYSTPEEVPSRLAELGLSQEILREAVERGLAAWASCTLNHPAPFPGIAAWAETVNALRERLIPEGWVRTNNENLPLTTDKAGRVCISASTGDENTGRADASPCTRSSKGPRTRSAVTDNARQYRLFEDIRLRPEELDEINGKMTWILLFYRDTTTEEVRSELSRPIKMNIDGQVAGWAERIILGSSPFGGDRVEVPTDVPQTPNVIVKVTRRSA